MLALPKAEALALRDIGQEIEHGDMNPTLDTSRFSPGEE
jgi:hypothetical protein